MNLKEYFERIDLDEIRDFVNNQVTEDLFLEFKTANYPNGIDFDKKNFSKFIWVLKFFWRNTDLGRFSKRAKE